MQAELRAAHVPLQAVQSIHEKRIVHSDLKPANFMLVQGQVGRG